ncbi:MAG: Fic family protein [Bacillota bacterium]
MKPLTVEKVLYLHHRIISRTGGQHGVRIPAFLDRAVGRPFTQVRGRDVYPSDVDKAGILLCGLIAGRCFRNGNKQTAVAAALLFLDSSGLRLKDAAGLDVLVSEVAKGRRGWRDVAEWLRERAEEKTKPAAEES